MALNDLLFVLSFTALSYSALHHNVLDNLITVQFQQFRLNGVQT
jgi:hypothetical protein